MCLVLYFWTCFCFSKSQKPTKHKISEVLTVQATEIQLTVFVALLSPKIFYLKFSMLKTVHQFNIGTHRNQIVFFIALHGDPSIGWSEALSHGEAGLSLKLAPPSAEHGRACGRRRTCTGTGASCRRRWGGCRRPGTLALVHLPEHLRHAGTAEHGQLPQRPVPRRHRSNGDLPNGMSKHRHLKTTWSCSLNLELVYKVLGMPHSQENINVHSIFYLYHGKLYNDVVIWIFHR